MRNSYSECVFVALLYNISPLYLTNGMIFAKRKKKLPDERYVFGFSLQLSSETFLNLRRIQRDIVIYRVGQKWVYDNYIYYTLYTYFWPTLYVHRYYVKYPLLLSYFNENGIFLDRCFEKYWNIKFQENPSSGSRVFPCGGTDRHDEANNRFSHFYKRA